MGAAHETSTASVGFRVQRNALDTPSDYGPRTIFCKRRPSDGERFYGPSDMRNA